MSTRGWTTTLRPTRAIGLLALLMTALAACDEDPTTPVSRPPEQPVAAVEVSTASTELRIGAGTQLTATPRAADGTPLAGRPVTWSSSDTTRATVSSSGFVTARAEGPATITARSGGRTGGLTIRVVAPEVASVRISPVDTLLEVGSSRLLRAEALAADGSPIPGRPVRWRSSDSAAVSVDPSGRITALREGIVVVDAEIDGKTGWSRVIVPPDLSGEWRLAVYGLEGGGVRCRVEGVTVTFARDGLALSGEAHPAEGTGVRVGCDVVGGEPPYVTPMPPNGPFAGGLTPAVAAALLDLEIAFEYDRWLFQGQLIGGAVTGTAHLEEVVEGRTVKRKGQFVLTKS